MDTLLVIGCILFLVAARLRFSDVDGAFELSMNASFFFLQVHQTKTSSSASHDRLPMEISGVRFIIGKHDWLQAWLNWRERVGIPFPEFPLFPEFNGVAFGRNPGSLTQFNFAMRAALGRAGGEGAHKYSSHGCKATLLTWMSRWGASFEDRSVLGYHKLRSSGSVRTYSRDLLRGPMDRLALMIKQIRQGRFHPENSMDEPEASAASMPKGSDEGPTQTWGPGAQVDSAEVSPTLEWPDKQAEASEESDSESILSFNSSTSSKDLNERTVHWIGKHCLSVGVSNEFASRLYQNPNPNSGKVHMVRFSKDSTPITTCNIDASQYVRLASGLSMEGLDMCGNCLKVAVKL